MSDVPSNIEEFNRAAGLIFAQLYKAFPNPTDIDQIAIGKAFGIDFPVRWDTYELPSGCIFLDLVRSTIEWLRAEGYIDGLKSPRWYGAGPSRESSKRVGGDERRTLWVQGGRWSRVEKGC
jgi:hypothetical protein